MTKLQRHNFAAVARQGSYVYCYLRHSDSKTGPAGSPYYIGLSSRAQRPTQCHGKIPVPFDRTLIRVLRSGLSLKEAEAWESFFITWYGREVDGGILLNMQSGGEGGGCGYRWTDEQRKAQSERVKGRKMSRPMSAEARENISKARKGKKYPISEERKKQCAEHIQDVMQTPGYFERRSASKIQTSAKKLGVDVQRYMAATPRMRVLVGKRVSKGVTGEDLWLPENIQPRTARMCREKGIDIQKYADATREMQCRIREQCRRNRSCPPEYAAA